jgi:hypothetical protein
MPNTTPSQAVDKLLRNEQLWREHDAWVKYKCNAEQMPRYCMLGAYGSPPVEKVIQQALHEAERRVWLHAAQIAEQCLHETGVLACKPGKSEHAQHATLVKLVEALPKVDTGREIRVIESLSITPQNMEMYYYVEADIDDDGQTWDLGQFDTCEEAEAYKALLTWRQGRP